MKLWTRAVPILDAGLQDVGRPLAASSKHGTDRTTKARRERIGIDKHQRTHQKAQKRTGNALPKVEAFIETGKALW